MQRRRHGLRPAAELSDAAYRTLAFDSYFSSSAQPPIFLSSPASIVLLDTVSSIVFHITHCPAYSRLCITRPGLALLLIAANIASANWTNLRLHRLRLRLQFIRKPLFRSPGVKFLRLPRPELILRVSFEIDWPLRPWSVSPDHRSRYRVQFHTCLQTHYLFSTNHIIFLLF
ncbi:uncharacterized protein BDR25DRAFT_77451 [Lindgomyces ingoldianus]|uniref:Uncharacterized protein n=1 Tax=Lindgomyces ingoldianus TaxID=673940 RepID=A0ACB6QHC2_9PLEO|nr:uncharacterized protein BDR25DRAFT_77451 [Lindgomyces ingoldianus]KAF2466321.1 hypothetical protein BDR25DRAFT_77451 [Lindgomyces ingoldianus]